MCVKTNHYHSGKAEISRDLKKQVILLHSRTNNSSGFNGVHSIEEALHVPWTVVDKRLLVCVHFLLSALNAKNITLAAAVTQ